MTFTVGQVVVTTDEGGPQMQVDAVLEGERIRASWWTKGGQRKHGEFPAAGLRDPLESAAAFDVEGFVAQLRAAEAARELESPPAPLMLEGPLSAALERDPRETQAPASRG